MYLKNIITYDVMLFYETDKDKTEDVKKYMGDELFQEISNIINKIKYGYESENIKKKINESIKSIVNTKDVILKLCDKFINVLKILLNKHKTDCGTYNGCTSDYDNTDKYITPFNEIIFKIRYEIINLYVIIASIYLLRKFLNKTHINNAIFYTTTKQTLCILYLLVNKFDFKITHSTNKKFKTPKLTKIIKKYLNFNLFLEKTDQNILYQCIDLTDFPDLFL
jgi:hypothetical protein